MNLNTHSPRGFPACLFWGVLLWFVLIGCGTDDSADPFSVPLTDAEGKLLLEGQVKFQLYRQEGQAIAFDVTDIGENDGRIDITGWVGTDQIRGKITNGRLSLALPGELDEEKLWGAYPFYKEIWRRMNDSEESPLEISNEVRGCILALTGPARYEFANRGLSGAYPHDFTITVVELIYVSEGTRIERNAYAWSWAPGEDDDAGSASYTIKNNAVAMNLSRGWNYVQFQSHVKIAASNIEISRTIAKVKGLRNWSLYDMDDDFNYWLLYNND